jgi:hypothetical protein
VAVPTVPTLTVLVTEALDKADAPGFQTRAESYWVQEIFNDIWNRALGAGSTKLRTLQTYEVKITTIGQQKYDFASDFDDEINLSILDGDHRDTGQAGGNTTITLAADEDAAEDDVVGKYILITGGTGVNGLRQAVAYNTTTKQATVDRAWDTNPDVTSTYLIAKQITELDPDTIDSMGSLGANTSIGKPALYARITEGVNSRFILDKPSDLATYGLLIRYYANIHKVDLDNAVSTLIDKIYQNWQGVLKQGIYTKALEHNIDSDRHIKAKADYEQMTTNLLIKEMPIFEEFEGFTA